MADHDSEAFYKKQLDIAAKERKLLQERLEALEKENRELRRSVFELSLKRSALGGVFDLSASLEEASDVTGKATHGMESAKPTDGRQSPNGRPEVTLETESGPDARAASPRAANSSAFDHGTERAYTGPLACRAQLTGHKGAVYALSWSPCGRYLASGSFDRSVRLWGIEHHPRAIAVIPDAHATNVSDLCWASDARHLFSAGFDHHVREWDWQTLSSDGAPTDLERSAIHDWDLVRGLVLCLANDPEDDRTVYAGTSNGFVYCLDRRVQQVSNIGGSRPSSPAPDLPAWSERAVHRVLTSASGVGMVNSMVFVDRHKLLIGDSQGFLHVFDLRKPDAALFSQLNDEGANPIAHIQRSQSGRYFAVNAFDDCLRIYDGRALRSCPQGESAETIQLACLQGFRGHRLNRMPLRCSLFERGLQLKGDLAHSGTAALKSTQSHKGHESMQILGERPQIPPCGSSATAPAPRTPSRLSDDDDKATIGAPSRDRNDWMESVFGSDPSCVSLVAATGSTDGRIFLYESQIDDSDALNPLDGHSDRVYAVAFHPNDMVLASCSADGTVKIWS